MISDELSLVTQVVRMARIGLIPGPEHSNNALTGVQALLAQNPGAAPMFTTINVLTALAGTGGFRLMPSLTVCDLALVEIETLRHHLRAPGTKQ